MYKPMWPFVLIYGSHDMRHTGFPQVDGGQRDPRELGRHPTNLLRQVIRCSFNQIINQCTSIFGTNNRFMKS